MGSFNGPKKMGSIFRPKKMGSFLVGRCNYPTMPRFLPSRHPNHPYWALCCLLRCNSLSPPYFPSLFLVAKCVSFWLRHTTSRSYFLFFWRPYYFSSLAFVGRGAWPHKIFHTFSCILSTYSSGRNKSGALFMLGGATVAGSLRRQHPFCWGPKCALNISAGAFCIAKIQPEIPCHPQVNLFPPHIPPYL